MSDKEIAHLESISPFYAKRDYMDELMIEREFEIIRRYTSGNKDVLEVGCGNGLSTTYLCELFSSVHVVEPSRSNIELLLKRNLTNITIHNELLEDHNTERKYDFVFFLNVIEHVEEPVSALKCLSNLVRDEGLIFVSAPNCMSLNRRAGYKLGLLQSYDQLAAKDYEVGHRRLYTVGMLEDHCTQAGLKVLEMIGMYLKPLSEAQMIGLGDDVVRAFYKLGEDVPHYCASLLAIVTKKYY